MSTQKSPVFKTVIGLLGLGVLGVILYPFFAKPREGHGNRDTCRSNLKQIGLGMMQYAQDYDDLFPLVRLSNSSMIASTFRGGYAVIPTNGPFYGWVDALYPYTKSMQLFQCPLEGNTSSNSPKKTGYTDYWYNSNLPRVDINKLSSPERILVAGDGNDGKERTDARYSKRYLPVDWITNTTKPAWRHPRDKGIGANYLYADGHVKLLRPGQISIFPGQPNTFSIK